MILFSARRAANFHAAGMECSETGNEDGAIENYHKALALDPKRGETRYNLGLIYKYRGDWPMSVEFNRKARDFQPDDEATLWNLAIAATALRDWGSAREVWRHLKIKIGEGDGPIEDNNRGSTPVRLNADGIADRAVEVVWAQRMSPVTARLLNIPTGLTGFRYHDSIRQQNRLKSSEAAQTAGGASAVRAHVGSFATLRLRNRWFTDPEKIFIEFTTTVRPETHPSIAMWRMPDGNFLPITILGVFSGAGQRL